MSNVFENRANMKPLSLKILMIILITANNQRVDLNQSNKKLMKDMEHLCSSLSRFLTVY